MIAMLLSLMLMGGVLTLFQTTLRSSRDLTGGKQLDNELHATLDLITRDLRRAGALGDPLRLLMGMTSPMTVAAPSAYTGEAANSCLTFSYDLDGDGGLDTAGPDERFGYRLRQGVVQMRTNGQPCTATAHWTDVNTAAVVQVTGLVFNVVSATTNGLTERHVSVTLSGRLAADPAAQRSVSRTVRLRNASYTP